jgi:hypothetical protein
MTAQPIATDLPAEFRGWEPFAAIWGDFDTPEARHLHRQASRMEDLRAFYDAVAPRLEEALSYLDGFPMAAPLPDKEARLYRTILGLAEAAVAVEIYGAPRVPYVPYPHRNGVTWIDRGKASTAP